MEVGSHGSPEPLGIILPLPYRVLLIFIIGLSTSRYFLRADGILIEIGIWLFGLNLHYFHIIRIEAGPMLRYTRSANEPPLHNSVYQVAFLLTALFGLNVAAFWMITAGDGEMVKRWEILPLLLLGAMVGIFLWPFGGHKRGRWRFLRMLRRIIIGGIHPDLRFADILLADALTSYARVLGDFSVCVCMFLSGHSSTNSSPNRACGGVYLVPFVMALPYMIRLRQCLTEYVRAYRKGVVDRRIHLANSCKYASALPVIICSALQRGFDPHEPHLFTQPTLSRMWLFFVIFNSFFSFYWDVARDWELTLFSSRRSSGDYPWGLRQNRYFVAKEFYYSAIILDFLLRATWSFKLSPHLDYINEMEGGIFVLELLEVFRRWVWTFFRVEKEWVASRAGGGLGLLEGGEGMQLQEFGVKVIED